MQETAPPNKPGSSNVRTLAKQGGSTNLTVTVLDSVHTSALQEQPPGSSDRTAQEGDCR